MRPSQCHRARDKAMRSQQSHHAHNKVIAKNNATLRAAAGVASALVRYRKGLQF